MKKLLTATLIGTCLFSADVWAARNDCSYSPIQDVVRTARDEKDIERLIAQDVNFNIQPRCGGDVLQLAIFRGNPIVLKVLLEKAKLPVDKVVSVADFPIDGAPKEIPFLAFAAYYAPRAEMLDLVIQSSEDVFVEDKRGENILWYMRRNPVLMNTALYDKTKNTFLLNQTNKKSKQDKVAQQDIVETAQKGTSEEAQPAAPVKDKNGDLVEPDRKFNPKQDALSSDF